MTSEPHDTSGELLTINGVAALLSVDVSTLYRLRRDDPDFPRPYAIRPTTLRFRRSDIDAWLDTKQEAPHE